MSATIEEAGGESAAKRQRAYRSPEVAGANDKWDWLYKVGVQKLMDQKKAGREQDLIVFEREKDEYTFHPNKPIVKKVDEALTSRNQQIALLSRARTYQAPLPHKNTSTSTRGPKPSAKSQFINQKKHEADNNPGNFFNISNNYKVPELEDDVIPAKPSLQPRVQENNHIEEDNVLYIDVKITDDRKARIVVKQTDDPAKLAYNFVQRHGLDQVQKIELEETLRIQMACQFTTDDGGAPQDTLKPATGDGVLNQRNGASKKGSKYKR